MKFNELLWLFLIVILVIITRAAFFFSLVPYNPKAQVRDNYLEIARNVVDNKGFSLGDEIASTSKRGPVPVYFFAAVLWLLGDHTLTIAFSNWIVDAITCVLLYLTALEIFRNKQIALISSLLFAFYVPGMYYSWQALSEPLFGLLLTAFVLSFLYTLRSPSLGGFAITGMLLGAASLTRPIMLYYLPIAIVMLVWLLPSRGKEIIKWAIVLSASFIAVMIPWTIRNYLIFGEIIPVNTNLGITAYHSNHALAEPDFLQVRPSDEGNDLFRELLQKRFGSTREFSDPEYDRLAKEEVIKIIRQYPGRYLLLSITRFFEMWYLIRGPFSVQSYLVLLLHGSLLVLAIIAFLYYRGEWWRQGVFLSTLLLYNNVGYAAIQVSVRYITPVVPYLMFFAAVAIVVILHRIRPLSPAVALVDKAG